MRKTHRLTAMLLIALLLFIQGIQPAAIGAELGSDNQFDLDIQVDPEATTEEAVLTIKADEALERVEIKLSDQSAYDEKKTDALQQKNVALHYNAEKHLLTLEWPQDNTEKDGKFVLTNIEPQKNVLSATGFIDGKEVVEIEHPFNVKKLEEANTEVEEANPETEETNQETNRQADSREEKLNNVETDSEAKQVIEERQEPSITAQSADRNLELYLNPLQDEVLSGKTANFQLDVKVTGSQTSYTNAEIIINLPKHPDVPVIYPQIVDGVVDDSLIIAGVTPVYNEEAGTLSYYFDELSSGQVYKTKIKVTPELGKTPVSDNGKNKRSLEASASINTSEMTEPLETGMKTVNVISNGSINITKSHSSTERLIDGSFKVIDGAPLQGDLSVWTVKASIPKTKAGISYIREGSKIIVKDYIPEGLIFDAAFQKQGFSGRYDAATRTVTWEFVAPSFNEQEQATDDLFKQDLQIVLQIKNNVPSYSSLTNTANVSYELHGSTEKSPTTLTKQASASMQLGGRGVEVPETSGAWYYGFHGGAKDGVGGWETIWHDNLGKSVPNVSDDARLAFLNLIYIDPWGMRYRINSGRWESNYTDNFYRRILNVGYKRYTMEYSIDPKLNLTHINIGKPFSDYHTSVPTHPLEELPETYVQLKINGRWKAEYPIKFLTDESYETGLLDVTQFGKSEGDHVEAYRVIYKNASGKMATGVWSEYDVHEGTSGRAVNKVTYNYELNDGTKVELVPTGDTSVHGPRYVNIVRQLETTPIVRTSIKFVDGADTPLQSDSNIQRGNNRIQIEFLNTASSQHNVTGPIELVALLPKGVNILDQPNANYSANSVKPTYQVIGEVNGQQQIKFTWDNRRLLPGEKVTASFDVDVTRTALSNLNMQVYGFSANSKLQVPAGQGDVYTQSVLETDTNDLNKNGNTTQPRVKSANKYSIVKNDNLQIMKEVKGSCDDEFSLFGHTTPDGDVTYRFHLTNTTNETIEQFMFLDVLPSVGDLGITDNKPRGSQFETTLKGPISFIGTKWENQVDVYYSTSKNPKRDDLYETVDYSIGSTPEPNPVGAEDPNWMLESEVTDWNKIHSFKIVMKEGVEWLEGQDIQFEVLAKAQSFSTDNLALFDKNTPETDRAAWNSFAVTTNGLLAVEPLRVGVAMNLGSLEVTKVDEETGEVLEGAEFELRDTNGDSVAIGTTDHNGKLTFDQLPFGNYQLVETKAPEGYRLLTKPIDVEMNCENLEVELAVKNAKTGWELPGTGGIGTTVFYALGALLMIGASLFLIKRKKTKE